MVLGCHLGEHQQLSRRGLSCHLFYSAAYGKDLRDGWSLSSKAILISPEYRIHCGHEAIKPKFIVNLCRNRNESDSMVV